MTRLFYPKDEEKTSAPEDSSEKVTREVKIKVDGLSSRWSNLKSIFNSRKGSTLRSPVCLFYNG